MAKYIGHRNADGTVDWPDVNINDQTYATPVTTIGVGKGRFVVVPDNFTDTARLERFRVDEPETSQEPMTVSPVIRRPVSPVKSEGTTSNADAKD